MLAKILQDVIAARIDTNKYKYFIGKTDPHTQVYLIYIIPVIGRMNANTLEFFCHFRIKKQKALSST